MGEVKAYVYYQKDLAGEIRMTPDGDHYFVYGLAYLNSNGPAISYSLPKRPEAYHSRELHGFFDGLLPEGWILSLAAEHWKLSPLGDRFELLLKTCKDPIGAVSIQESKEWQEETDDKKIEPCIQNESLEKFIHFGKCLYCYEPLDAGLYHTDPPPFLWTPISSN